MYVFIFQKNDRARILGKLHLLTMCNVTCSHNLLISLNYYTITSITSNFKKKNKKNTLTLKKVYVKRQIGVIPPVRGPRS